MLKAEGRLLGAGSFSAFVPQTAIDSSERRRNIYSITIGRLVESVGPTYLRKGGWHGCREWRKCQLWKKPELLVAYPKFPGEKPLPIPDEAWQGKKKGTPAKGRRRRPPGVSKSDHRKVVHCISQIVATAIADADSLVEHIDQLAEHLSALGCTTKADVEHYFRKANRTLVSLYFAARQPQPSPNEHETRAGYALDARRPVEGDLRRFEMRRLADAWEVVEHSSAAVRVLPFHCLAAFSATSTRFPSLTAFSDHADLRPNGLDRGAARRGASEADGLAPNGSPKAERQSPRIKVELTSDTIWLDDKAFQVKTGQAYFVDAVVEQRGLDVGQRTRI